MITEGDLIANNTGSHSLSVTRLRRTHKTQCMTPVTIDPLSGIASGIAMGMGSV